MPRVAVVGSSGQGKSTLVGDFIRNWPAYRTPQETYRSVLRERNLGHSRKTDENTQSLILDWFIKEEAKYRKGDKVIFDRCSLDALAYTLWAHDKGIIRKEFVDAAIVKVRESLRNIDIVFFVPITRFNNISIESNNNDLRDCDPVFITEIDNIFKALVAESNKQITPFFARDDKPPIIEVFGSPQERIEIVKLYLDNAGDEIGDGHIIDPNELDKTAQQLGIPSAQKLLESVRSQSQSRPQKRIIH